MTNAPLALAAVPPDALDDEYRALHEALSESARGRAFLSEYGRRNRDADTEALLAAIERIEARLRADASAVQRLRDDLRMLLIAIRLARPDIDAAGPAAKAVKLSALLDLLERRYRRHVGTKTRRAFAAGGRKRKRHARRRAGSRRARIADPRLRRNFEPRPIAAVARAPPVIGKPDPLAAIMALSEDERACRCLRVDLMSTAQSPREQPRLDTLAELSPTCGMSLPMLA